MSTFDGKAFSERGDNGLNIPGWDAPYLFALKHIPGSDDNVIQRIGADVQRLAMPVKVTASQLAALQAARGDNGSLVWSGGTDSAFLSSVGTPTEVRPGKDVYFVTLNFIKL